MTIQQRMQLHAHLQNAAMAARQAVELARQEVPELEPPLLIAAAELEQTLERLLDLAYAPKLPSPPPSRG